MFKTTLHSTSQTGASRNLESLQMSNYQTSERAVQKDCAALNTTQMALTVAASDYSRNNQARTALPQRRKIPTFEKIKPAEQFSTILRIDKASHTDTNSMSFSNTYI